MESLIINEIAKYQMMRSIPQILSDLPVKWVIVILLISLCVVICYAIEYLQLSINVNYLLPEDIFDLDYLSYEWIMLLSVPLMILLIHLIKNCGMLLTLSYIGLVSLICYSVLSVISFKTPVKPTIKKCPLKNSKSSVKVFDNVDDSIAYITQLLKDNINQSKKEIIESSKEEKDIKECKEECKEDVKEEVKEEVKEDVKEECKENIKEVIEDIIRDKCVGCLESQLPSLLQQNGIDFNVLLSQLKRNLTQENDDNIYELCNM